MVEMKKKSSFSEILKNETLTKESYLFQIEQTRAAQSIGFFKIEVFNYKKQSVFKFKIQIDLSKELQKLKIGESISKVGLVSLSNKNFYQMLKGGIENAIGEGRIPFAP